MFYNYSYGRSYPENKQFSFRNDGCLTTVTLSGQDDIVWKLNIKFSSDKINGKTQSIKLGFPVYQSGYADIDNDGSKELLIGVIKTARFHNILAKRLFIYDLKGNCLRPKLLCSRIGDELLDFKSVNIHKRDAIRTLEKNENKFGIYDYHWGNFSIIRVDTLLESSSYGTAKKVFTEKK